MNRLARAPVLAIAIALLLQPVASAADGSSVTKQSSADEQPDQAIKCRTLKVTGSLVKTARTCKTVAEWKRIRDEGNRTAGAMVDSGRVCAGGSCGTGSN